MNFYLRLLIVGVLLMWAAPAFAQEFVRCEQCHAQTLERDRMRFYQHQPFMQQECRSCHSVPVEVVQPTEGRAGTVSPRGLDRRRVAWLEDSPMAATEHTFLLPADQLGEVLIVEARDEEGGFSQAEFAVPMLVDITPVIDAGRSPVISDVQVLDVRRGIFLSVTIGWSTDTLTNARVLYGLEDLSQSARNGGRYGSRHQVVLNQLKPGKTYNYQVVARDMYGREERSQAFTFSTARAVARSQAAASALDRSGPGGATERFRRHGSDYLLTLQFEKPSTVFVGRKGPVREQVTAVAEVVTTAVASVGTDVHANLSNDAVLTIQSCRSCHIRQASATHPVGVLPKPGMVIPSDYPTLPDGRISCVSCHAVHGSNNEYLARKSGKRDLCVGCHQDML